MIKNRIYRYFIITLPLFIVLFSVQPAQAQVEVDDRLTVFLDCSRCDDRYIKTEINFVEFVRDQGDAQIHLFITSERTGAGGIEYVLNFIGREDFSGRREELTFTSFGTDTDDERRIGLVQHIKLGLVPYLVSTENLSSFDLIYDSDENVSQQPQLRQDKWNNWIFEIGANGFISGEESRKTYDFGADAQANRTTEKWKIRLFYRFNYNRRVFETQEDDGSTSKNVFIDESQYGSGLLARSVNQHLTVGAYFTGRQSTRDNYDALFRLSPSIEYSLFPYSEFARREVTLRLGLATSYNNYTETTIFGEREEYLLRPEFNFNSEFTQPWGSLEGRISGGAYLQDLTQNRIDFDLEVDMRVTRGVSFFINGRYSVINDQLSLSAEGSTDDELLLDLRQQATSYNYRVRLGFEVTFGSIFDTVVNPRF